MSEDDLTQWWSAYDEPAGTPPPDGVWAAAVEVALAPASEVDVSLYEQAPAQVSGPVPEDAGYDGAGVEVPDEDQELFVVIDEPSGADGLDLDPATDTLASDPFGDDPFDIDAAGTDDWQLDDPGDF
ncbi:hypothetical protein GOHSU_40_00090 [Gordonia hirsuta DSM 44140 = NBRC 16056]|uniref:Uncharacterized protein n=1 Tax=Gordonia hirsuta DSM 44140 = NBRC 16056 TaxID=1121927 RepID=L7LBB4_9ACTN|nr:hypothetical protein [Gordonia hirsuta]GAC58425.1 hypothetical protein GOHSU_40_00090 [Gordonia hirsuta DSM 44140 = NBRC 16056]